MKKILTLCVIQKDEQVLLGLKKRGFGAGRWNGFGGKVHGGETIEEAAKRELREEANIDVKNMEKVGILIFDYKNSYKVIHEVHIFRCGEIIGDPKESEEMKPQWFAVSQIPFDKMWPDDKYWFPLFLAGRKFTGKFLFGENDVVLEHNLEA
ncbi:8-oxo-dGTP diphosphatase [Patescibacteria group bacterium]|nr:MAG: 8-oxo-dGTP diphosphatase [Patescibacteria group bacterium]